LPDEREKPTTTSRQSTLSNEVLRIAAGGTNESWVPRSNRPCGL
jgi:hypothetical protein